MARKYFLAFTIETTIDDFGIFIQQGLNRGQEHGYCGHKSHILRVAKQSLRSELLQRDSSWEERTFS
jgi:hypothetical protein